MEEYIKEIQSIRLFTKSEELTVATKVREGDLEAREQMITHNLRLVIHIAKRYMKRGIPFQDLIGHGNLGLIVAVEKFKPELGFRFTTYATHWIKQRIRRAICDESRIIRIPSYACNYIAKLKELNSSTVEELEDSQIMEELGIDSKDLLESVKKGATREMHSLDIEENQRSIMPQDMSPQERDELITWVKETLENRVNQRNGDIVLSRWGLDRQCERRTLQEVANVIGISRERIRQIESEVIKILIKSAELDGLIS